MHDKTPLPVPQLLTRALEMQRSGQLQAAQALYSQVLALQPQHFVALHLSGVIAAQGRDFERADALLARAVEANPHHAVARNNRGNVLKELGRYDAALSSYDAAISLKPDYAECHFNRAVALHELSRLNDAVAGYDRAIALKPDHAEAHSNRGIALAALDRLDAAVKSYDRAIALRPDDADVYFLRGLALQELGLLEAAVESYDKTIALRPGHAESHANRGAALQALQRLEEAVASFHRAIQLGPNVAEVHYNLGVALQELARPGEAAASFRTALRLRPDFISARWALAFVALPPVFSLGEDPALARSAFGQALDALDSWFARSPVPNAHEAVAVRRPFYLSYQEYDNKPLLSKYGALCHRLMNRWQQANGVQPAPMSSAGRVRVGIVSSNICAHSVWAAITKGIVLNLDPRSIELHVFHLGSVHDRETELARSRAAVFVTGKRTLAQWTEAIVRSRPEVLIYPEVGMHGLTSQLASERLAPVQAALWGHPETTGLPTIDYFLTGDCLESSEGQAFYTEQLIRLPHLGCCYAHEPEPLAAEGGDVPPLAGDGPLLVCPGTTFKYMPQHDWVYAEIARELRDCRFVFFSQQPRWTALLQERLRAAFATKGLDVGAHVTFVPWLTKSGFQRLMRRADVLLDAIGFSGFNTAMQAVECGLPIVTRSSRFMRGRLAGGILARMRLNELIADSDEDYVQRAVRLVRDEPYRHRIRREIFERQSILFNDLEPIRAMERFLLGICRPPDMRRS